MWTYCLEQTTCYLMPIHCKLTFKFKCNFVKVSTALRSVSEDVWNINMYVKAPTLIPLHVPSNEASRHVPLHKTLRTALWDFAYRWRRFTYSLIRLDTPQEADLGTYGLAVHASAGSEQLGCLSILFERKSNSTAPDIQKCPKINYYKYRTAVLSDFFP
jgi:hypothetical protein